MSLNPKVTELLKGLQRQEETQVPGAVELTPKQLLLNANDAQEKNPDKRVRWVNLKNPEKVLSRQHEGYTVLPAERGGKRLGDDFVLMEQPIEKFKARVAKETKMNQDRLKQHKTELEALAEQISKQLRDNYGVNVPTERLLVNEA